MTKEKLDLALAEFDRSLAEMNARLHVSSKEIGAAFLDEWERILLEHIREIGSERTRNAFAVEILLRLQRSGHEELWKRLLDKLASD